MFENNCAENISITGITPLEYYPCNRNIIQTKQNMQSIDVLIPCEKPDIESIEEVKVSICIIKSKLIDTILGKKVVFNGAIKLKAIYTANNYEQSVHSAHWDIPFCDFILLDNICSCDDLSSLDLFAAIEDLCINYNDLRCISFSVLYIICASVNKVQLSCNNQYSNQCSSQCNTQHNNQCNNQFNKSPCIKYEPKNTNEYKNTNCIKDSMNTYYYTVEHY